jgi:hypothetical protein
MLLPHRHSAEEFHPLTRNDFTFDVDRSASNDDSILYGVSDKLVGGRCDYKGVCFDDSFRHARVHVFSCRAY